MGEKLDERGWRLAPLGFPDIEEFELLANRNPAGNLWWARLSSEATDDDWLAWLGYGTRYVSDFLGAPCVYPSIFLSPRDDDPAATHPYRPRIDPDEEYWQLDSTDEEFQRRFRLAQVIPREIVVIPGVVPRVLVRTVIEVEEFSIPAGARYVADNLQWLSATSS